MRTIHETELSPKDNAKQQENFGKQISNTLVLFLFFFFANETGACRKEESLLVSNWLEIQGKGYEGQEQEDHHEIYRATKGTLQ